MNKSIQRLQDSITVEDTCASSIGSKNKAGLLNQMLLNKREYEKARAKLEADIEHNFSINSAQG